TNNSEDSKSSTTSLSKQAKKKSTQFYASSPKKKIKVIKRKPLTYLKEWEKQYSWLIYNEMQKKWFVNLCLKHNQKNDFGKKNK
ncbi:28656_t:CDS:1, partial [Gigaspora margarita]